MAKNKKTRGKKAKSSKKWDSWQRHTMGVIKGKYDKSKRGNR